MTGTLATLAAPDLETAADPRPAWADVLAGGLVAGVLGYATTAIVFAAVSVAYGHSPFHVAALIGADLFLGVRSSAAFTFDYGVVLAYNGLHLLIFIGVGLFMALLARLAGHAVHAWYALALLAFFVVLHVLGLPMWFREPVQPFLSLWVVTAVTLLATAIMGTFLWSVLPLAPAADGSGADDA